MAAWALVSGAGGSRSAGSTGDSFALRPIHLRRVASKTAGSELRQTGKAPGFMQYGTAWGAPGQLVGWTVGVQWRKSRSVRKCLPNGIRDLAVLRARRMKVDFCLALRP